MIHDIEHEPTRVVCVGRALVDVPAQLETSYGMTYFAGWNIETHVESAEAFRVRLQERLDSLAAERNGYGDRSLETAKDVGGDWEGKILRFARESLRVVSNRVISYKDIVKIEGHLNSAGVSFDISAGVSHEKDFEDLLLLVQKLKVRGANEIPSHSGFCFDRGIVLGKENPTLSETVTLFAGDSETDNVAVVIDSVAGTRSPDSLMDRIAKSDIRSKFPLSFRNLRIGVREINGYQGEEVLTRVTEDDGRTNHSFIWESTPVQDDIYRPQLTVELSTGHGKPIEHKKTPYTDAAALALWDQITQSLRSLPLD